MKKIINKIIKICVIIVAIVVVIFTITVISIALSDSEKEPEKEPEKVEKKDEDIELNASIKATDNNLQITNDDSYDWINVRIRINNDYLLLVDRIESGRTFIVGWQQFIDKKSMRFNPYLEKATKIFIYSKLSENKTGSFLATRN